MPTLYDLVQVVRAAAGAPTVDHQYAVQLVGIRSASDESNLFDDAIAMAVQGRGVVFAATTDPGRPYLERPLRDVGTAILAPGHYAQSHRLGLHKGYPALVQAAPLRVWRDNDRDAQLDRTGAPVDAPPSCGLNIHSAADDAVRPGSTVVGRWSAGCQVVRLRTDLRAIVAAVERQKAHGLGDRVSYTLVDVRDLEGPAKAAAEDLLRVARRR